MEPQFAVNLRPIRPKVESLLVPAHGRAFAERTPTLDGDYVAISLERRRLTKLITNSGRDNEVVWDRG